MSREPSICIALKIKNTNVHTKFSVEMSTSKTRLQAFSQKPGH